MIPELGHFSLILAFVLALVQAIVPLVGARRNSMALMAVGRPAAQGQFFFIVFSYVCLTWAFVTSDFSVQLAASNSHVETPLMYKNTGVWGNHEGSLLLWAMSLSLWTVAVTVLSLLPVMLSSGLGMEIMKPIATPTIGGMLTSTIYVLFLIPCLFAIGEDLRRRRA